MSISGEKKKILVAMSGNVDSSVAAALLKHQGYEVLGLHLQLWRSEPTKGGPFQGKCCLSDRTEAVQAICRKIDVPLHIVNVEESFQDQVVDYFVHEYLQSRTPNPCVRCHIQIKFNTLFQKADELGCEWVATGHYAQVNVETTTQMAHLSKAVDSQRDQTYFLGGLTQKALQRLMMPIGGLTQNMVQRLTEEYGFDSLTQNSQPLQVCFIGQEGYSSFIEKRVAPSLRPTGVIRTSEGAIVGEHLGFYRYSIGQQTGLQLYVKDPDRYFVIGFDAKTHALIVGLEKQLFNKEMMASHANWIKPMNQLHGIRCLARISLQHKEAPCRVTCFENGKVHIEFDEAQRQITPGQVVVFYEGNEALGGAFIESIGGVSLS